MSSRAFPFFLDFSDFFSFALPKIKELFDKPVAELSEIEFWSILIMAEENKKARLLLNKLTRMQEEMDMAQALLNQMSRDQQEWENQIGYERFVHDCISREKYAFMQGEKQASITNAKKMLTDCVPEEQVAKWTSLPLEQVLALKEKLKTGS
ncbi:hypothetical protein DYE50_03645 [Treponema ruminis]|uniref:Antitoxin component HigA of HigAB toxin-antitoxin module n=1 Tax=Treponema ruminis TaxID=744515 RepID=A0A7W8G7T8_9SPIR|nr:hypothetical protein [Treponema ruminis]MBB5225458.1 antitoxin component HigA of HigAB toxin-antitoxin module [Treponema ruminis]QSI01673.1 hypothetical protein DYE50_03645 [Treponema ruminis]